MRNAGVRWTASVLLVLAVHGSMLLTLNRLRPAASAEPSEAIKIDLAPVPAPPAPVPAPEPPPPKPPAVVPPAPAKPPERKPVVRRQPAPKPAPQPPAEVPLPAPAPEAPSMPGPAEPPAPAPPPPAAADPAPSGPAVTNWQGRLVAHLARFKQYPDEARLRGEQGVVLMRLTLSHDGRVIAASLAHNSGHPDLDAEGQAWIRRAEPYPAFPPEMTQPQIEMTVPLRFTLQ